MTKTQTNVIPRTDRDLLVEPIAATLATPRPDGSLQNNPVWFGVGRRLGWATADRQVEAEGRAEAETQREPGEKKVERSLEEVKRDYGETLEEED